MTRSFYSYAIFFTSLYIIIAFFQSILYFQLGARLYELPSLTGWFVFSFLLTLIWSLIILKYYHYKQYQFAFWTLTISIVVSIFYTIIFYQTLATREITVYFIVAVLLSLLAGSLYGISLIFSVAGKRSWLKAAGVFLVIHAVVMLSSTIWTINSVSVRINGTTEKIEQWSALIESFGPLLFIMNFLRERATAKKAHASGEVSLSDLMGFVAFAVLVSTLIFVPKLTFQSMELSANPDNVGKYLTRLAEPFEARTYVNSQGNTMRYRLMKPLDYDSTKQYPLVVCLHGSSASGTDNVKQVAGSLPVLWLSEQDNRTKYPAFLFVPQCPRGSGWGGMPNVPAVDSLVFETISTLEKEFSIDADRRYVTGNSMGGYGAWHFICVRPEMFAAAIPISGEGDPGLARNIVDIPVWAFHGAKDRTVPVSGSRDIIEAIKKAGGVPRYTEYPEDSHHIGDKVKATPGLLDWLFAQERD